MEPVLTVSHMLVSVKWSGKKFDNVELDTSQPGFVFKSQLFSLTGVEPERQKIMIKGGMLKVRLATGHGMCAKGPCWPSIVDGLWNEEAFCY